MSDISKQPTAVPASARRVPSRFLLTAAAAGAVLAIGGAILLSGCGKTSPAGANPFGPHGPAEIGVQTIIPRRIVEHSALSGRLSAVRVAEVRPQISGIVQKRVFTEGAEVQAGALLYQIDPAPYQAAYDQARGTLVQAQAALSDAQSKATRYAELVKIHAVSQQDDDDAQAAVREDAATVISDQGALETARINLSYTHITAPITGRIGTSSVTEGALVTADQTTALATIQTIDQMYLDVTLSSTDWLRLRRAYDAGRLQRNGSADAVVNLIMEDGRLYTSPGHLQFTDITVDGTTGSVTTRVIFPNPAHLLLPGMFVRAELEEGVNPAAILVPQLAVARASDGGASVLVVGSDGRATTRAVHADTAYGDQWLVTSGLNAGDKVIVSGLQQVQAGVPVKIVTDSPGSAGDDSMAASAVTAAAAVSAAQ